MRKPDNDPIETVSDTDARGSLATDIMIAPVCNYDPNDDTDKNNPTSLSSKFYNSCDAMEWLQWNSSSNSRLHIMASFNPALGQPHLTKRLAPGQTLKWLTRVKITPSNVYFNATAIDKCHDFILAEYAKAEDIKDKENIAARINFCTHALGVPTKKSTIVGVLSDIRAFCRKKKNLKYYFKYLSHLSLIKIPIWLLALASFYLTIQSTIPAILSSAFSLIFNIFLFCCAHFESQLIHQGYFIILSSREYLIYTLHECYHIILRANIMMLMLSFILQDQATTLSEQLFLLLCFNTLITVVIQQLKNTNDLEFRQICLTPPQAKSDDFLLHRAKALKGPIVVNETNQNQVLGASC
ncbi:MAG: hypothetical protein ACON5A_03365 [Candidatus Comchoanobacterales bacterium]